MKKKIAVVLGIRPDVIRASLIIKLLKADKRVEICFIWSGQHYSDNLKDIFFRELDVPKPDIDLGCKGETDAQTVSSLISRLFDIFLKIKPDVAVFLGDTNTVLGSIAAAQLNIPIVHIEGCMRSYDWRMPEEKYRTAIDHLSDLIYCYLDEYKEQGIREGLNPKNIMVVGNPIVDILKIYFIQKKEKYKKLASNKFFEERGIEKHNYFLMTAHRRENVESKEPLQRILDLAATAPYPVYFPASYRTQKRMKEFGIKLNKNIILTDPIGYTEFLTLLYYSKGAITDSGTVVEEACILQIPSIQMRKATERPQVYDVRSAVKFDPSSADPKYKFEKVFERLAKITQKSSWKNPFGDGESSKKIVSDLVKRVLTDTIQGHRPESYHLPINHSYTDDHIT